MLDRMYFVFVSKWTVESVARSLVPLTVLGVAMIVLPASRARQVAFAAMLVGVGGLVLTFLGADILRIALVAQSQPWRWLWLTNVVAILLLPLLVSTCWHRGLVGRATLALVISLWLFRNDLYCAVLMPCVVGAAFLSARQHIEPRTARLICMGSFAALALGIVWAIANNPVFAGVMYNPHGAPIAVERFRALAEDGLVPVALFAGLWWCAVRASSRVVTMAAAGLASVVCLAMLPIATGEWTTTKFTQRSYDALEAWRRHIPVGTEVLWMDVPIDGWVLLRRPIFFAMEQTGSALFSRAAAMEVTRRDALLARDLPPAHFMMPDRQVAMPGEITLARACNSGELRFIATRLDLGAPALEPAPKEVPAFRGLRLYRCEQAAR
jgi:hypothetical protein